MAITANIVTEFNDKGIRAAEGAFGKLSKGVAAAGAAIATGLAAVTKGLYEAVQAAAEDQKSFTQLAQAIKNVTGASDALVASTDKQIGKMSMQLGIADDKLRPAFANLVRATGDLNIAQKGLNATADLATAKNIDLETASSAVGKALAGNTTALVKMLPGLKGVIDNGSSAADVLAAINSQVGGAAEANTRTFAGALARLKVIFGEMVETVGSWLLPALTKVADLLNGALGQAFTYLSEQVGPKVESVFTNIAAVFRDQIAPVLVDYVIPAFKWLAEIYYNQVAPALESIYKMLVEKVGKAFEMLREKLEENRDRFDGLRERLEKVITFVTRYWMPAWERFMSGALDRGIVMVGKLIDVFFALERVFAPVVAAVGRGVMGIVKAIVGGINLGIDAINAFINLYNRLPSFLKPGGNIAPLQNIELPTFDLTTYKPGGFGSFGENRGGMPTGGGITGIPETIIPAPSGGRTGGRAAAAPSPAVIPYTPTGIDPFLDNPFVRAREGGNFTVNVEGGLATSAEIGRAVVDAIKQYTNVSGPANIAVA